MPRIDPSKLQFVADYSKADGYSYRGQRIKKIAIQLQSRFRLRHRNRISHEVYYSDYHEAICYSYWPGARWMMMIAPPQKKLLYLNRFIYKGNTRKSRFWRRLHRYVMVI